jgi:hypothetical protein
MCPLRVVVAQGMEWGMLSDEVSAILKVTHSLMEPPSF